MNEHDFLKMLERDYKDFSIEMIKLIIAQIIKHGPSTMNLAMTACLMQAEAEVLKTAVEQRGDVRPEDFDRLDKLLKSYIRKSSMEIIEAINKLGK